MRVTLSDNVLLEHVGSDVMAMVPGADQVVALSGESARIVTFLTETGSADLEDSDILDELIRAGVVHPELAAGPSRRGLLVGAAGVAGAGVLALSMPSAAMASSDPAKFGEALVYTLPTISGVLPAGTIITFKVQDIAAGLVEQGDKWKFERAGVDVPKIAFPDPLTTRLDPSDDDGFFNFEFDAEFGEEASTADFPATVSGTLFRNRGGVITAFLLTFDRD